MVIGIMKTSEADVTTKQLLDESRTIMLDGAVAEAMTYLSLGLTSLRAQNSWEWWQNFAKQSVLEHPLTALIHQDPFTRHSFTKPRGYAGDAELLDLIYGLKPVPQETTNLGRSIFEYSINTAAPQSVRARREVLTQTLYELVENAHPLRVLSIACGHLREAQESSAVTEGIIKEFWALDQDPLSLAHIRENLAGYNVHPLHNSVREILSNKVSFKDLDLVYAAGLYDYLSVPVAARLTRKMWEMLRPGGKLLVANFAPNLRDIGYMETFMAWWLIYRDETEVADFATEIPVLEVAEQSLFRDSCNNVIFLEMVKC